MGTWGAGIMENDLALDVKEAFEGALEESRSVAKAVKKVMQQYERELDAYDEYPDMVLSLAWLVSARGKTEGTVFQEATRVIRDKLSLKRWEGLPDYEERQQKEQQLLDVVEGRASHPEPVKRRRTVRVRIGDVFEISLSEGRKAYAQHVFFDSNYGPLVQVFNLITTETPPLDMILSSDPRFPPVLCPPAVAVELGIWRVIGHSEVTDFKFPIFRLGNWDRHGRVRVWALYDGKQTVDVGKLPPGAEKYEFLTVWPPVGLARRIETGENFYDTLRDADD